jgi:hypothetical protein
MGGRTGTEGFDVTHGKGYRGGNKLGDYKVRSFGVEHGGVRLPNVLWNPGRRRVMLVDFERSEISKRVSIL